MESIFKCNNVAELKNTLKQAKKQGLKWSDCEEGEDLTEKEFNHLTSQYPVYIYIDSDKTMMYDHELYTEIDHVLIEAKALYDIEYLL